MTRRKPAPKITYSGLKVLSAFLRAYDERGARAHLAGADIMDSAKMSSGTLYPLLLRFEEAGVLESKWEDGDPAQLGRPLRRFYKLTGAGVKIAREAMHDIAAPWMSTAPQVS